MLTLSTLLDIVNRMVAAYPLSHVYRALGDPTRLAILTRLRTGEARISDLAPMFTQTLWGVSKHVRVLEDAGLIVRRRSGREHWLTLRAERLEAATSWLEEMRPFWEARLDSLERYLDSGLSDGAPHA